MKTNNDIDIKKIAEYIKYKGIKSAVKHFGISYYKIKELAEKNNIELVKLVFKDEQ